MQVWSLDWEDPPEKEMATHSSILAWKFPWTGDPGGLQSMGSQKDPIEEPSWLSNENILPPMQQHLREVKPLASDQQHVSYRAGIPNPILRIFLYHIVICARSGHPKDLKRLARAWVGGSQMFQLLPHSPCHLAPPGPMVHCQVERPPHSITIRAWNESNEVGSCPFLRSVFIAFAAEIIRCSFQVIIFCLFTLEIWCLS